MSYGEENMFGIEKSEYSLPGGFRCHLDADGWNEWSRHCGSTPFFDDFFRAVDLNGAYSDLIAAGKGEFLDDYIKNCSELRRLQAAAFQASEAWYKKNYSDEE